MYGTILRQVILTYHTCSYKCNGIRYSIPEALRLIFFGASLLPFTNKDGGIRPVAIGLTLRRPIEKLASSCALVLRSCEPWAGRRLWYTLHVYICCVWTVAGRPWSWISRMPSTRSSATRFYRRHIWSSHQALVGIWPSCGFCWECPAGRPIGLSTVLGAEQASQGQWGGVRVWVLGRHRTGRYRTKTRRTVPPPGVRRQQDRSPTKSWQMPDFRPLRSVSTNMG